MPSQTDIAYILGIILPPEDKHLLPKSHKGKRPKAGWGTRINLKRYSLTNFFGRQEYHLQETFRSGEKFETAQKLGQFLRENAASKNDILVCFNYPLLYNSKGSWGHASLVERIDGQQVILRDPSPNHKRVRRVFVEDLLNSIRNHYCGGIWIIATETETHKNK